MRELRLAPAAVLVWMVTAMIILSVSWVGATVVSAITVVIAVVIALVLRQVGQAVLLGVLGTCSGLLTWWRLSRAQHIELRSPLIGTVSSVSTMDSGDHHILLSVDGYPAKVSVFYSGELSAERGALISAKGWLKPDDFPGLSTVVMTSDSVEVIGEAQGYAAWVNHVRDNFAESVSRHVGESSQGLIPGMVLGDTRGQSTIEAQMFIDTGLSHLSAVSGSNVSILVSTVMVAAYLLTIGPRIQVAVSMGALLVFVSVVGTEPSVLRAAVMGVVGLLAVINSSRMEPIHGLSLAVMGLLIVDSNLAVQYGFVLSVAATAGIVALFPLLYRALAPPLSRWRVPDIVVRAFAVAIAADLVTMPIIALMAGRISLVAVLANVLVDLAVAPITVIGLIAVLLSLLPDQLGPIELVALKVIEPFSWWIYHVAQWCQRLPNSTLEVTDGWLGIAWVVIAGLWMVVAIFYGHIRKILITVAAVFALSTVTQRPPAPVDPLTLNFQVIETVGEQGELGDVDKHVQLVIVEDPQGPMSTRPIVTKDGVPVLFPYRDGEVTLHVDGTQRAADGRF
ncbi:competence protein ComE-like protein [Corynebacterium deserti GIMN1.010]|uniref:Competence protein ComE-like protein n=1 Tax=Corynebacterium deserti GIMN1.010 TaxID=931089 RepID=A0A0M5IJ98_9CORY|nr:ComEC/Rec2 family competence protein [Corynebacterium deserti]ALC06511.1 competence protein ComE-like protein [Corynebacterium deserti GIMN1.010]